MERRAPLTGARLVVWAVFGTAASVSALGGIAGLWRPWAIVLSIASMGALAVIDAVLRRRLPPDDR